MHYRVVIFFLVGFAASTYFILNWRGIKSEDKLVNFLRNSKFSPYLGLFILVAPMVLAGYIIPKWGNEVPDSFWERNQYETYIYVKLYPEDKKQASYLVKAKISARDYHEYYIKRPVFVEDYGFIDLDCEDYLSTGWRVDAMDQEGRHWQVELTDKVIRKKNK